MKPGLKSCGPHARAIASAVAESYGLTFSQIASHDRPKAWSRARFAAYHALHQAGYSMPSIGTLLGGRDHSTIHHGYWRHEAALRAPDMAEAA